MTIHLYGDIEALEKGINHLIEHWGIQLSDKGVDVKVIYTPDDSELVISYDGEAGEIKYNSINSFFREFNRWLVLYKLGKPFKKKEQAYFDKTGTMIDASRNAVLNVDGAKELIRHMASLGLNLAMLYTEDTYEVEDYPYFGYLRGKYSKEELNELDDYAHDFGIEMIPCIQTLGHLYQVLQYGTHSQIMDTSDVLLVGEPKTYEFLEKIIKAASDPFRSNRIHIGMDEAFGVGTGRYKQLNGEKDTFSIMNEHVQKVIEITDKLGLESMMWSDMYFRAGSKTGDYYDMNSEVPEHIVNEIPNVDMVFWDYYHEDKTAYTEYLKRHLDMKQKVIFAGGVWTWNGISPNYGKSFETTKAGLSAAKELGIKEVFATMWGDDGGETPILSSLPGLQVFAELSYSDILDHNLLNELSTFNTGLSFDEFTLLNKLDETPGVMENNINTSAGSKVLLWQDPLLGRFDKNIEGLKLNEHYKKVAEELYPLIDKGSFTELFDFYYQLADVLSDRAEFGVRIKKAYDENDREALEGVLKTAAALKSDQEKLRLAHRKVWMLYNKPFGWEVLDIRYGGIVARMQTVIDRLSDYLEGRFEKLEELEETKLKGSSVKGMIGRGLYTDISSTSKLSGV